MQLDEIHRILGYTHRGEWNVINRSAPVFPGADVGHYGRAAYKDDVLLGLAWGLPYDDDVPLAQAWSKVFSKPEVTGTYVDVIYAGMLVDRYELVFVDGRLMLPQPDNSVVDGDGPFGLELIGQTVTALAVNLARLVNYLDGATFADDFDNYLKRTGFVVTN